MAACGLGHQRVGCARGLILGVALASMPVLSARGEVGWFLRDDGGGPSARWCSAMAYDAARGSVVVFGGRPTSSSGPWLGDTWEWDGASWVDVTGGGDPVARAGHAMVQDTTRGVTVLFGGYGPAACTSDTWERVGGTWVLRSTGGPAVRECHAMAYDSSHGVVVLLGGYCGAPPCFDDTWLWDGTTWSALAVSGPPARTSHAMAYDAGRGVVVLYGGIANDGMTHLGDTWEWDGVAWTLRSTTGPGPRDFATMVYDAERGVVLLFGGRYGTTAYGDLWAWDGDTWTMVTDEGPSGRMGPAMAFDTTRGVTVLFGGYDGSGVFGDTWELGPPVPAGHLVLWNKLGSDEEVLNSEVGPPGALIGSQYAYEPGMHGDGYVRKGYSEQERVEFPASILHNLSHRGTIELWINPKVPNPVPYSYGIFAFVGAAMAEHWSHIRGNVYLMWGDTVTGQGFFGAIQFDGAQVRTPDEPTQFVATPGVPVHAAICWDIDGIDGTSDTVRVYRDGLVVGVASGLWNPEGTDLQDRFWLGQNADAGAYDKWISDNIKVWDYAKTDFSDRFYEDGLVPCELERITASDGATGNLFGYALGADGDYLVVGARTDDEAGSEAGAVYVFKRDSVTWTPQAKLIGSGVVAGDWFGGGVAMDSDTILAGTTHWQAGILGDVYVFRLDGGTWQEEARLRAADAIPGGLFGGYIAVSGDVAAITACRDDEAGYEAGAAYIFRRDGTTWAQEAKLIASDAAAGDAAGNLSVGIDANAVAFTSYMTDSQRGAAYVFEYAGGTWTQTAKLVASDGQPGDRFGTSVALDGDYLVVGADQVTIGGAGKLYVFHREGGVWTERAILAAADGAPGDLLALGALDIQGDRIVAGASEHTDSVSHAGAAYLFVRDDHGTPADPSDDIWPQRAKLTAANPSPDDRVGVRVAQTGPYVFGGADRWWSGRTGFVATWAVAGDCNLNGVVDACDIAGGTSLDVNGDGVPDECGVTTHLLLTPDAECYSTLAGPAAVVVELSFDAAENPVTGGQFFLAYDNSVLNFESVSPGDAPFTREIYAAVNEAAGTIDYAVGLGMGESPTSAGTVMARLTFSTTAMTVCDVAELITFRDHTPPTCLISTVPGETVATINIDLPAITIDGLAPVFDDPPGNYELDCTWEVPSPASLTATDNCDGALDAVHVGDVDNGGTGCPADPLVVTRTYRATDGCGNETDHVQTFTVVDDEPPALWAVPGDIVQNADAGGCTAQIVITPPVADDNCDGSVAVNYERSDSAALTLSDPFPSGTTSITWSAEDTCGNPASDTTDVTVEPYNTAIVDLTLSPTIVAGPLTRCITFEFCAGGAVLETQEADAVFVNGVATGLMLDVPCGSYACVRARDKLHTLAQAEPAAIYTWVSPDVYFAGFMDGGGSDDRLVGGNLNDDDFVDIIDFGIYVVNENVTNYGSGNTPCNLDLYSLPGTPPFHADINGDGFVAIEDFSFIQINFLESSEAGCCETLLPIGRRPGPFTRISTQELSARGLGALAVADLNYDGWLDEADRQLYTVGARPWVPTRSSLGSPGDH